MRSESQTNAIEEKWRYDRKMPFWAGRFTTAQISSFSHVHSGIELGAVISGSGILKYNGKRFQIEEGDIVFMDASLGHGHDWANRTPFTHLWIHIPIESTLRLTPSMGDLRLYQPFIGLRLGESPVLKGRQDLVHDLMHVLSCLEDKQVNWDLSGWSRIVRVLTEIALDSLPRIRENEKTSSLHVDEIAQAVQFINGHFLEPVTIAHLAELVCMSESRFSHVFSKVMNTTPIQYRNQLRIQHALDGLRRGEDKISTIAFGCGFKSMAQFRSVFKKVTGFLPGDVAREKA